MSQQPMHILLIEDNPGDARLLRELLRDAAGAQFGLAVVDRLSAGLQQLDSGGIDAILLDLTLPDSAGLTTLRTVYAHAPQVPVVVLTGLDDEAVALQAMQAGAQDYLIKGRVDGDGLARALRYAIERQHAHAQIEATTQALRASEARNRAVLHALTAHIAVLDEDGTIIAVNAAWERFARANGGAHLVSTDARTNYLRVCRAAAADGDTYAAATVAGIETVLCGEQAYFALEYPCHAPDEQRWFVMHVTPLDASPGVVVAHENISERKRAEQALHRKTNFVQLLQDVAVAANLATSIDAALRVAVNQICSRIGWPVGHAYITSDDQAHTLVSADIWYLVEPSRYTTFQKITEAINHAPLDDLPGRVLLSRKPEWISDMTKASSVIRVKVISDLGVHAGFAFPVLVGAEVAAVLEFFSVEALELDEELLDVMGHVGTQLGRVVERQHAEVALREDQALLAQRVEERTAELSIANAELQRTARLKDEFLASMSHELRTPLTAVLGLSEVLQEEIYGSLNVRQQQSLQSIQESGQHLLDLINDILDVAKIGAGKLELAQSLVSIEGVCRASLQLVKPAAQKKQLTVASSIDPAVTLLYVDGRRVKQILVNLLSNAVKFTPHGGALGVEVVGDPHRLTVDLTVWDTGIGIAPGDLNRLFQPFVQLDSRLSRQYNGTGLGLTLVYRMAELHGGSVRVESQPGAGSRFTVTLPWQVPPDQHTVPELQSRPAVAEPRAVLVRPLILLAEDNETTIVTLTDYLEAKGYQMLVARNGDEAVARSREAQPALILMDIQMPGMDGLEAIRRIRTQEGMDTPIIAVTALAMPGDRERCLAAGANAYLSKPVSLKGLIATIDDLLRLVTHTYERGDHI